MMQQRPPRTLVIPNKLLLKQINDSGLKDIILQQYDHVVLPTEFEERYEQGVDRLSPGNLRHGNDMMRNLLANVHEVRGNEYNLGGANQVLRDMSPEEREQIYMTTLAQTGWFGPDATIVGIDNDIARGLDSLMGTNNIVNVDMPNNRVEQVSWGSTRALSGAHGLAASLLDENVITQPDLNRSSNNIDRGQRKRDRGNFIGKTIKKTVKKIKGGIEDDWLESVNEQGKHSAYGAPNQNHQIGF